MNLKHECALQQLKGQLGPSPKMHTTVTTTGLLIVWNGPAKLDPCAVVIHKIIWLEM